MQHEGRASTWAAQRTDELDSAGLATMRPEMLVGGRVGAAADAHLRRLSFQSCRQGRCCTRRGRVAQAAMDAPRQAGGGGCKSQTGAACVGRGPDTSHSQGRQVKMVAASMEGFCSARAVLSSCRAGQSRAGEGRASAARAGGLVECQPANISHSDGQRLAVETWQECKFQGGHRVRVGHGGHFGHFGRPVEWREKAPYAPDLRATVEWVEPAQRSRWAQSQKTVKFISLIRRLVLACQSL